MQSRDVMNKSTITLLHELRMRSNFMNSQRFIWDGIVSIESEY